MSAFAQPESDSEDELPPGWEERATLGNINIHEALNKAFLNLASKLPDMNVTLSKSFSLKVKTNA